jgi:hypothetical protein
MAEKLALLAKLKAPMRKSWIGSTFARSSGC